MEFHISSLNFAPASACACKRQASLIEVQDAKHDLVHISLLNTFKSQDNNIASLFVTALQSSVLSQICLGA